MKVTIYYATHDRNEIKRISEKYIIPSSYNVNGETEECDIHPSRLADMQCEVDKKLIEIRRKNNGNI